MQQKPFLAKIANGSLVIQILAGIIFGIIFALISPTYATDVGFLGELFVSALKSIAPILVFILVASSIANQKKNSHNNMKPIIVLYLVGTFMAAVVAVVMSFLFPTHLTLITATHNIAPPEGITAVIHTLLLKIVDNPIHALMEGNFIGILAWAIALGISLHQATDGTKGIFQDLSNGVTLIVRFIIRLAPIGIFGLVAKTFAETGLNSLLGYVHLVMVLLASMMILAFIINPLIVYIKIRKNPYPLIFRCIRVSGLTAFFTRSSAANIPVNMQLCKDLDLHEDTYSVSIPLGATINMGGAAITITVMTLAAVNTLNIPWDIGTALLLSLVAAVSACGASGVAGGSLLLVPLACSLFGIPNEIAMQVVAIGFIIGVIQDSAETALNSSTDVIFTAAACLSAQKKPAMANLSESTSSEVQ